MDLDFGELGAAAGDLDVARHTDAELHAIAALAARGLLREQRGIVGDAQRFVERELVVAAVVAGTHDRGVRELVGLDEVLAPELGGVHVELVGRHVDDALENAAASGRPAPRYAPIGVVLVTTTATSNAILGMWYTPCAIVLVWPTTSTPPKPPYAPASPMNRHRMPTIVPSRFSPSSTYCT